MANRGRGNRGVAAFGIVAGAAALIVAFAAMAGVFGTPTACVAGGVSCSGGSPVNPVISATVNVQTLSVTNTGATLSGGWVATSINWTWGDSSPITQSAPSASVSHTYTAPGSYRVTASEAWVDRALKAIPAFTTANKTVTVGAGLYSVAFTESNLPLGANWTVTLGTSSSLTRHAPTVITFFEPAGTYAYVITSPNGTASPEFGNVTVAAGAVSVSVTFTTNGGGTGGFAVPIYALLGGGLLLLVGGLVAVRHGGWGAVLVVVGVVAGVGIYFLL